jgi:hypothetical protein
VQTSALDVVPRGLKARDALLARARGYGLVLGDVSPLASLISWIRHKTPLRVALRGISGISIAPRRKRPSRTHLRARPTPTPHFLINKGDGGLTPRSRGQAFPPRTSLIVERQRQGSVVGASGTDDYRGPEGLF